ncbi:MAG: baseplate J/gp47 family protein [Peptococcaceae bacterium]|nr:baseplate J/gp47 family protein [Peptococcaceae bacterium]
MRTPEIYRKNDTDIINHLRKIAGAYTPEWRFDEEHPDVGTALALIYADMFAETAKRFNMAPDKHKTAFFNGINAKLLPAIPAAGYVTFGLAGEQGGGVAVRSRTQMTAEAEGPEAGNVIFETAHDVYVTPSRLEDVYNVSGRHDIITRVATAQGEETPESWYLFDLNGVNIQEHILYFGQKDALYIKNGAWIEVEFLSHYENRISEEALRSFLDDRNAVWEYRAEEDYLPFDGAKVQDGKLLFFKSERQPGFASVEENGAVSCWIRCRVQNITAFEQLYLDSIRIASQGRGILPDVITSAGADESVHECFPFGEKMSLFSDVYFASEEALSKKGAMVKLNFNMNFMRIPIDLEVDDPTINWKLIMRRSDFKPDAEFDITIEDVVWEYYNGQGWARLFPRNEYRDVFSTKMGTMGQYRSVDFLCPEDMEKILINSCESHYIRCRILKLNNMYKVKGNYVSPYIESPSFSYAYENAGVIPDACYTVNNLHMESYHAGELRDAQYFFKPFKSITDKQTAIYMGFSLPLEEGPIKLLFSMADSVTDQAPRLVWEYYGKNGWTSLNVVDETRQLRKTGIVTFMGSRDFRRLRIWDREQYWIRVVDVDEAYNDRKNPLQLSRALAIWCNATQVYQLESRMEELFYMEHLAEDFVCQLLHAPVQDIEVWVDELGQGEPDEWKLWEKAGRLQLMRDAQGELYSAWVRWTETEDLALSDPDDRHYLIDRNRGEILFGDGKNGRIPTARDRESVRVAYRTGGGEIGNLREGAINRINVSIGFINGVQNPGVTSGGCDQETVREALTRTAATLKHGYRGVTASDYEALALEASRNIRKAKCFANRNGHGEKEPGSVTLVILQKDFQYGRNFFGKLQEQVYQYIADRVSGNIVDLDRFYVAEPQFLELSVKAELSVRDFDLVFQVKEAAEKRLEDFINPVTGNFDGQGWGIGSIPNQTQITNSLNDIAGISFIKGVTVTAYREDRFGRTEVDMEHRDELLFGLPLSGRHEILIAVEERR